LSDPGVVFDESELRPFIWASMLLTSLLIDASEVSTVPVPVAVAVEAVVPPVWLWSVDVVCPEVLVDESWLDVLAAGLKSIHPMITMTMTTTTPSTIFDVLDIFLKSSIYFNKLLS
jgi:hypothetical protein